MEKIFKLSANGTTVSREIVAGLTTFMTMAYILAVNPGMLGETGMPPSAVFTATALSAAIATLIMAFAANLPVALAPGMGLNAFFTYTVVFGMGYSWQIALTAVFIEGILFIIMSLFNVREAIVKAIPANLKKSVVVGVGLLIALIGLVNSGIVIGDSGTITALGDLTSGSALVALIGIAVIIILYSLKVRGSVLIGILATTIIGIPFGVTSVPAGGWTPIDIPAAPLFFQFEFENLLTLKFFIVLFTFLFVDIFDTIGALVCVTQQAGLMKNGEIPRVKQAFLADAIGTVVGAALGTSTVTSYGESSVGVAVGGRTGLTSLVTAILFLLSLFLAPVFLLIPSAATGPALIFVGFLMMQAVTTIDFKDPTEGIPAFFTIIITPFGYSVAEGIVYGIMSYVILKVFTGKLKDISIVTAILFVIFLLRLCFS
ncbi:MAG: NCS2 family permease [Spirochaetia bacterium]|jgi:AGZA family xanthine/uracil permease-like MFS transporter|nr:NCS2 family permease [Spirochaetia bacterium]